MVEAFKRPTLCIGVLALNEERRIEQCLKSASFADQLLVVDSGSHDATVERAQACGAEVLHYPDWKGFAEQRNRLLTHVQCDYVFYLDADEVITPELRVEIESVVAQGNVVMGRVGWCEVAFGKTLHHMRAAGGVARLFQTRHLQRFEGVVHEQAVLDAPGLPVYRFRQRLLHYSRETVYGCLQKLAQYVQLGAVKRAQAGKRGGVLRGLASGLVIFVKLYVLRLGFTGGAQGFLFCLFIALECFFRYAALGYDKDLKPARLAMRG